MTAPPLPSIFSPSRRRELLAWILIPLISFLWFWFWRSNQFTGGDSEYWEREIARGHWFRKRQMFSFAAMQSSYRITHFLFGFSSRLAINLVSCMAGSFALLVAWRMVRGRDGAPWPFLILATAGFTTLFFGHVETYALPAAFFLLHLLAIQRTVEGRWAPWSIVATFSLVMAFHMVALFTLPAAFAVALSETRRRRGGSRGFRPLLFAALPALVLWLTVRYGGFGEGLLIEPYNWVLHHGALLRRPWAAFTDEGLPMKAAFALWNAGAAAVLGPAVLLSRFRDRVTLYFLLEFLCLVAFTLLWNAHAGAADFDLFCFPWIVAVAAFARHAMTLPFRSLWVGLTLGANFALWLVRPVVFSDFPNRGYGTIEFELGPWMRPSRALIDERLPLEPLNRYVPLGPHLITVRAPGRPLGQRVVVIRGGDRHHLLFDSDGLHVVIK